MDEELYNGIGQWSKKAFPDADSINHINKMKIEADEVIQSIYDTSEYADCLIALVAAAYKADISFNELKNAIINKLEINKERNWKKLSDGSYQHI